jgi:hypothetical protein
MLPSEGAEGRLHPKKTTSPSLHPAVRHVLDEFLPRPTIG